MMPVTLYLSTSTRHRRLADFTDLYDASCLNGWTMGNIATTPSDVTQFYQAMFNGKIVSKDSLTEMQAWKPLTTGAMECLPRRRAETSPTEVPTQRQLMNRCNVTWDVLYAGLLEPP